MQALGSLVVVAAALLAIAGVAKLVRPGAASLALRGVGLPSSRVLVRLLGIGEAALAAAVMATAHPVPILTMGVLYLGFAGFVVASMRAGEQRSCGCFGEAATPPGPIHVAVDAAIAAMAAAAAILSVPALPELLTGGAWRSGVLVAGIALSAYLLVALLTTLPQTLDAVARVSGGRR